MLKAMLISSVILNVGLLLGRISGFVRQSFIATAYGDSPEADVVVFMLTVPDLLVNILMGGAFGAVLIPALTKNTGQAKKLLYQTVVIFGVVTSVIAVLLFWQSELLVRLLAPGFNDVQSTKAAHAFGLVVVLIPLTVMAGGTTAYLQYKNKFSIPSLGTLIVNISIIFGLYFVYTGKGQLQLLAGFVVLGGFLRLASQVWAIKPNWNPLSGLRTCLVGKTFFKHYGRAMLTGSILIFFPVIAKAMASFLGEGSYAIMDYALKLIYFPLVIAVTFISTIFFPRLSSAYQTSKESFSTLFKYGIQATLAISCIATVALYFVSEQYASLVYQHGEMGEAGTLVVGSITSVGLLSLPVQGLIGFLTMACFAQKNTKTPLLFNGVGLCIFLLLSIFDVFGQGLIPLTWALVVGYVCVLLLYALLFKNKEINMLFSVAQPRFIFPLLAILLLLCGAGVIISWQTLSSPTTLLLSFLSGIIALFGVAVMHPEGRKVIMSRAHSQ
jgi:murein biosynthesis integral membrane protein MurJ